MLFRSQNRENNIISFEAVSGAGLGSTEECDCTPSEVIRTINGIGPNSVGNLGLSGDACVSIRELRDSLGYIIANTLIITDDCTVCCGCDDYIASYNNLRKIWENLKAANELLKAQIAKYTCVVNAMKERCLCLPEITTSVRAYSRDGWGMTIQVVVGYSGPTVVNEDVSIDILVEAGAAYTVVPNSGSLFVPSQSINRISVEPSLSKVIPYSLAPGTMLIYEVELFFTTGRQDKMPVNISVLSEITNHGTAEATTITYLKANFNKV